MASRQEKLERAEAGARVAAADLRDINRERENEQAASAAYVVETEQGKEQHQEERPGVIGSVLKAVTGTLENAKEAVVGKSHEAAETAREGTESAAEKAEEYKDYTTEKARERLDDYGEKAKERKESCEREGGRVQG